MVGRDDNEVLNLYRGECKFAALHISAFGTKRTYRDDLLIVRFWCTADMRSRPALIASDANDPDRTQTGLAGCDRKQPARERPKLQPLLPKHPLDRVGEAALAGDAVAEFGHARGRIAALAGAVALSLAPEIGGSARAQTGDDTAGGSINIGARAGLAGDAPVRTAPRQDGAAGPFELSARAGFASDYIYRRHALRSQAGGRRRPRSSARPALCWRHRHQRQAADPAGRRDHHERWRTAKPG